MTQYINKKALITAIEKRKNKNQNVCTPESSGAYYEDGFILDIIDSMEEIEATCSAELMDQISFIDGK